MLGVSGGILVQQHSTARAATLLSQISAAGMMVLMVSCGADKLWWIVWIMTGDW
jgi:hypothetical protein